MKAKTAPDRSASSRSPAISGADRSLALPAVSISTKAVPPADQFALWQEYCSSVGSIRRLDDTKAPFRAKNIAFFTSSVIYSRYAVKNPCAVDRSPQDAEKYGEDTLVIQLRQSGVEHENNIQGGRKFKTGDIRIIDLARPLFSATTAYENLALAVSKSELKDRVPNIDDLHGSTMSASPMTAFLKAHFHTIFSTVPKVNRIEAERLSEVTLETIAAALLIGATPNAIESSLLDAPAMRAVRHYIKQHLCEPGLSPEQIALGVGMSRSKLFHLCKGYDTPMEMVRRYRLQKARSLLEDGKVRSVEEASYQVGFRNRCSFSRSFRSEFGAPAREFLIKH